MGVTNGDSSEADSVLLQRFLHSGDEQALETLVRRYHGLVLGVCSRVLRHRQWAEDAYQSTFQVLIEQAGSIRRQEVLASWLYGVAYRISRRVQRREVRRMSSDLTADVPHDDDPFEKLCRDHESELLDDELARLPASLRQPLILRYQLNLSNVEVGQRLKISVAAVEGRLKRARAILRYRLARQGVALSVMLGLLAASQQALAEQLAAPGSAGGELVQHAVRLAVSRRAGGTLTKGTQLSRKPHLPQPIHQLVEQEIWQMAVRKTLAWTGATIIAASLGMVVVSWPVRGQAEGGGAGNVSAAQPVSLALPTANQAEGGGDSAQIVNSATEYGSSATVGGEGRGSSASDPFTADPASAGGSGPDPKEAAKFDISRRTPGEQRLFDAMSDITALDVDNAPLGQVLANLLHDQHQLQYVIDAAELQNAGTDIDAQVSLKLEGVSLRAALKHLLDPLELAAIIEDEVVRITSRQVADETFDVRLYRLPKPWRGKPMNRDDIMLLTDLVLLAAPDDLAEKEVGIVPVRFVEVEGSESALVVRATSEIHDRVNSLLRKLD